MVRINILIITYKQQELIKRCLDSILCQKEFGLNNIIINDDCSPDNTWQVLCEYAEKFPTIVKPYRNQKNLGIYGNWNEMIKRKGDADVYYIMAGDDALCDGIFKTVQDRIVTEHIVCTESVAMYFDWKVINPNGVEVIYKNNAVLSTADVFGLKLRNRISGRSCFVTEGLMKQYPNIRTDYGISLSETLADLQYSILAKKNYYSSYVGSVYYSGIGVSKNLFTKEYYSAEVVTWDKLIELFHLTGKNRFWGLYKRFYCKYMCQPNLFYACKALFYYIIGERYLSPIKRLKTFAHLFLDLKNNR